MSLSRVRQAAKELINSYDPRWRHLGSLPPGANILELGCGGGSNLRWLSKRLPAATLTGVDILGEDDASIRLPPRTQYQVVDLERGELPFAQEAFDAVLLIHVLEHLRRPLVIAREVHRVLRPGGTAYVETPNWTSALVPSIGWRREQHQPFNFYDDPTHVKPWSATGISEFLASACELESVTVGVRRNWPRVPFDLVRIPFAIARSDRPATVASFWNIYGWCVYGIGTRPQARR